jgi:hypothetical protein
MLLFTITVIQTISIIAMTINRTPMKTSTVASPPIDPAGGRRPLPRGR